MTGPTLKLAPCALLLAVSMHTSAQSPQEQTTEAAEARAWTLVVVSLDYADAEEVAGVLSRVLPPTVRVVAYGPTNSLIVAGDPAIVGDVAKHAGREAAERRPDRQGGAR